MNDERRRRRKVRPSADRDPTPKWFHHAHSECCCSTLQQLTPALKHSLVEPAHCPPGNERPEMSSEGSICPSVSATGTPAIAHQAELIEEIQTDQWWEGVTVSLRDLVRLGLRDLVQYISKSREGGGLLELRRGDRRRRRARIAQIGEADFARFKQ
jgi:hypothetical protein